MNARVETTQQTSCYHCGLPIPKGSNFFATIAGVEQPMCCPGCQAVAQTIVDGGLANFYRHRTNTADENLSRSLNSQKREQDLALFDDEHFQSSFVTQATESRRQAALVIDGITCAACVWLLDHHVSSLEGVIEFNVNLTTQRARLIWDQGKTSLSKIASEIEHIGYQAHPYKPDTEEQILTHERKRAVRRLGVAGLGMMQVMMMAAALYAGTTSMDAQFVTFIRWASFAIATPVALYSALPFYRAALRDLKVRHLSMDVPVSIAILGAYCASAWATVSGTGDVYFDSVTMFTFFLLMGRYMEMQARHRAGRAGNALLNLLPNSAVRLKEGTEEVIAADQLQAGDIVLIKPGHSIPADATILEGDTTVDESALTGEYIPQSKAAGAVVIGGTVNIENPITAQVTTVGAGSKISAIISMLEKAQTEKPKAAQIADRVAGYFVAFTLAIAALVASCWYFISPNDAFWVTLSVLVITCPCALSLATPTALTAATGTLRKAGFLVSRAHVLETLGQATHIIFDKTGTLTEGRLHLEEVVPLADIEECELLKIAGSLEAYSEHPIASAFASFGGLSVHSVEISTGQGLKGIINDREIRLGKPNFAQPSNTPNLPTQQANASLWLLMSDEQRPLAWFRLSDEIRSSARASISELKQLGLTPIMLTGDQLNAAQTVADAIGIETIHAAVSPEGKLDIVNQLNAQGAKIVMVGDGINDIPALAGAQLSVAMKGATDLAKTSADAILIANDLNRLPAAIRIARKTRTIIRENIGWAIVYNLTALPLAATGFIPPYMAAIGMSLSSLIVVGNALRLTRKVRLQAESTLDNAA